MATRFVTVIACPLTAPMRHPSGEARGALIAWPPLNTSAPLVTATSGGSRRTGRAGQGRLSDSIDYLPLHMWEASPTPRPRSTPNRRGPSRRIGVGDPSHTPSRSRLSPSRRRRRHCNSNPRNHFEFCRQKLASRQNAPRDGLASHSTCGRRLRRRGRAPLPTAAAPSRPIGVGDPSHRRAGSRPRPPTKTVGDSAALAVSWEGRFRGRSSGFSKSAFRLPLPTSGLWPQLSAHAAAPEITNNTNGGDGGLGGLGESRVRGSGIRKSASNNSPPPPRPRGPTKTVGRLGPLAKTSPFSPTKYITANRANDSPRHCPIRVHSRNSRSKSPVFLPATPTAFRHQPRTSRMTVRPPASDLSPPTPRHSQWACSINSSAVSPRPKASS